MIAKLFSFVFLISSLIYSQVDNKLVVNSINSDELRSIISNRGDKFLLVNVWATWCIPCREEFPDLVKLFNKYKSDLDIIAISVDYPEEVEGKVIPFLNEIEVPFPVFVSRFNKDSELIELLSNKWNGALPGTFIYNKEGIQIKFLEGKQSFEGFSSIINDL